MEGALRFLPLLAVLGLAGCHGSANLSYPTYAEIPSPYIPNTSSNNAFDAYVLAAGETNAALVGLTFDPLHRSFFTPDQRKQILSRVAASVKRVGRANGPCDFKYVPIAPGAPLPYRAEWRLIGRALRWRIDDQFEAGQPDQALNTAAVAFRFSADICGGGPGDRTLGVEIANDVREAILPGMSKLSALQLRKLANVTKAALTRRPALSRTLLNGEADMRLAIQTLLNCSDKGDYSPIQTAMGREFIDIKGPLDELKNKPEKRLKFFNQLDADHKRLSDAWQAASELPARDRGEILKIKLLGERPRKAFARHFFLIGKPLLEIEDRSVARLRLLVLEAELRKAVISTRRAPASLVAVKPPWAIDPYSGITFGYLPDGSEFRVYSVGSNLRDDLGDTDAAGLNPDIRTVFPN